MAYSQRDSMRFDKHNYDIIISHHMSANPNLKRLRIATPIAASTTRRELFIGTGGEGYTGFHQRLSIRDTVPTQPPGSRVEYLGKRQSAPDCTTVSLLSRPGHIDALHWTTKIDQPIRSNIFFRPFSCFIAFASTNQRKCRRITTIFYSMLLSSRKIGKTQTSRLHFWHHDYNLLVASPKMHGSLHHHPITCRTTPTSIHSAWSTTSSL